ncbi:MAG: hypothetical protein DCC55_35570 [Chloroflexi bacterium]|nr:MAG: hypothetical protein DCC55_35570 [Chloroflexota bacterium]
MSRSTLEAEWYVAQDDAEWKNLLGTATQGATTPVGSSHYLRPCHWSIALLLLLPLAAIGSLWCGGQPAFHRNGVEMQRSVQQRLPLDKAGVSAVSARVVQASVPPGSTRILETGVFVFHFYMTDAAAIIAVAPQMDRLYTTLRSNFGLPAGPPTEKLIVDVSLDEQPGAAARWLLPNRFVVPSPALYPQPPELSEVELLSQSITLYILSYLLQQAGEYHAIRPTWQPVVSGLYLWQLWELDLTLSAWQEDVVQWVYAAPCTCHPTVVPERYAALCAAHKLWMPSPVHIHIPLACVNRAREEELYPLWYDLAAPKQLSQFPFAVSGDRSPEQTSSMYRKELRGQTVALAALIEYTMVAYGQDRLPALLAGLGEHEGWETLIPAVFGVPASDLEAGWQIYLAAHYDLR